MFHKLNQNLIISLVVAVCGLSLFAIASADNNETIRGGKLTIENPTQGPRFSISALRSSASNEFTSDVINTDKPFNAISFSWDQPKDAQITLMARFQKETWTEWQTASLDGDLMENSQLGSDHPVTSLIFTPYTNIFQYKFIFTNKNDRNAVSNLTASYIDSSRGSRAVYHVASDSQGLTVIPRSQWGADESYRFADGEETWPRDYYTPKRFVIHHTDSSDVSNPLATLRAIYYFHTKTHDWGDIGYNYLIDASGNIYEGRAGGDAVVGAHAFMNNQGSIGIAILGCYQPGAKNCNSPEQLTPATKAALDKLIAAKSQQFGINPTGKAQTYDKGMQPTIIGHRDVGATNCPGDRIYVAFSELKSTSATTLASLSPIPTVALSAQLVGEKVAKVNVPSDSTTDVLVRFKNTGDSIWRGYQDDHLLMGTDVKKLGRIDQYRLAQVTSGIKPGFKLVEGNVKPGETGTFKITVKPNDGVKTYTLAWLNKGYLVNTDVTITAVKTAATSYVAPKQDIITGTIITSAIPSTVPVKSNSSYELTILNTGNVTWTKENLKFQMNDEVGVPSSLLSAPEVLPNEDSIAPGSLATLNIAMQAPEKVEVLRNVITVNYKSTNIISFYSQIMVVTDYSAMITSESIPDTLKVNAVAPVSITIKNIGSKAWKGYQLKSTNEKGYESAMYHKTWNGRKIIVSKNTVVQPGEEITISVKYWAPTKAGNTTQLYKLWSGKQVINLNGQEINQRTTKIIK